MKILILNGSPRLAGNTATALKALKKGMEKAGNQVEYINAVELQLRGCLACDGCKKNSGRCVISDDGADFMDKVMNCDMILFGSPVYWWGVSAQLKLALDKFYSKVEQLQASNKKIGILAVGAEATSDPEYKLISDQFKCIAEYLKAKLVFDESISAWKVDDVANNASLLAELEDKGNI